MIYSITCDQPSFRTVNFKKGFNVVLAERTKEATRKDSRNGLGKSTLIEIIHFCLGGKKGETLQKPQLDDWTFTLDIDLAGKRYSISRNTKNGNKLIIDGDCSGWPIKPYFDELTKEQVISRDDWTKVLGALMFFLRPDSEYSYHPTFRSLISYFVRRNGQRGGFLDPFQQYKSQKQWDIQVANAYLLGLGWEYAARLQVLKDRNTVLEQIKKEATSGLISSLMGNIGDLEAQKIRLEDQKKQEKENLDNFKVHPQYRKIGEEANVITDSIHEKVNQNIDDKRLLEYYEASLKEEADVAPDLVSKVYREAGLIFSDTVTKKIEEVLTFHKKVVSNRESFLSSEIKKIKQRIMQKEQDIQSLTSKRAELLLTLKTHGALQEYVQLQANHQDTVAQLKDITLRLDNLKKFEQGKSSITVEQELLQQEAINDLDERGRQKESAILAFNSYSEALYDAPGTLSINLSKTGFKFAVDIQRSGSHGIGNMKIFCYDLVLAQLWAKKVESSMFLIHDSVLFADVDERQRAHALELAANESGEKGFQYICTMNSDSIPKNDFSEEFNFDKYITMKFTDATEDGGILGIRF
jgi:uncharacterized protein YydD (DUF2326 family)